MDSESGLVGSGWQDYLDKQIQPALDQCNQQISGILANGAHGAIARRQMEDDAGGAGSGGEASDVGAGTKTLVPYPSSGQIQQTRSASPPSSYGDDASFHPAHLDAGSGAPALPALAGAAQLGTLAYPQTVNLQSAIPIDTNLRNQNIARGNTDQSQTLAAFASNPTVSSALDNAWAQSHSNGYIDQRHEINAFGRRNSKGDIWVEPASTQYEDSNINISLPPPGNSWIGKQIDGLLGDKTIFVIHTHPNPGNPATTGPSQDDVDYAKRNRLPIIIQGTYGLHFYDPAQHK